MAVSVISGNCDRCRQDRGKLVEIDDGCENAIALCAPCLRGLAAIVDAADGPTDAAYRSQMEADRAERTRAARERLGMSPEQRAKRAASAPWAIFPGAVRQRGNSAGGTP